MRLPISIIALFSLTSVTFGQDLLQMAVRGPDYIEFKRAIDAHPEAVGESRTVEGQTLLHLSAANRHQEGVLILLIARADPNARDQQGWTPLMSVIGDNPKEPPGDDAMMIADMLLFAGADPNVVTPDGTNALYLAVGSGQRHLIDLLLRSGANPAPAGVTNEKLAITRAWHRDDKDLINLLQHPPRIGPRRQSSPTATRGKTFDWKFEAACIESDYERIDKFVQQGVNINQQNDDGETALYKAVKQTRADLVSFLLWEGADPNIACKDGRTPLIESTRTWGFPAHRMTAVLLLSGADISASHDGWTPLSHAVIHSNVIGAKFLIYGGADLNVRTPKGSLMQAALAAGWQDTISVLKQLGLPEEAKAKEIDNVPAIVAAVRRSDYAAVKAELERGISPSPPELPDLLGEAFWRNQLNIADLLISYGANINYQDKRGGGALFILARGSDGGNEGDESTVSDTARSAKFITEMVKRGANVNMKMHDGTTPLMVASRDGRSDQCVQALLAAGANVNARNHNGQTALAIARQFGRKEIIKLLQANGGVE